MVSVKRARKLIFENTIKEVNDFITILYGKLMIILDEKGERKTNQKIGYYMKDVPTHIYLEETLFLIRIYLTVIPLMKEDRSIVIDDCSVRATALSSLIGTVAKLRWLLSNACDKKTDDLPRACVDINVVLVDLRYQTEELDKIFI